MMFALLVNGIVPGADNVWTPWTALILRKEPEFGFKKVAMVKHRGSISAYTSDFVPMPVEIKVSYE